MKADLRISVKHYRRNKNLKILLLATSFSPRRFFITMNGTPWPDQFGRHFSWPAHAGENRSLFAPIRGIRG
jgi:hypothetical protein